MVNELTRELGGSSQLVVVKSAQGLDDASGPLHDRVDYSLVGRFTRRHQGSMATGARGRQVPPDPGRRQRRAVPFQFE